MCKYVSFLVMKVVKQTMILHLRVDTRDVLFVDLIESSRVLSVEPQQGTLIKYLNKQYQELAQASSHPSLFTLTYFTIVLLY